MTGSLAFIYVPLRSTNLYLRRNDLCLVRFGLIQNVQYVVAMYIFQRNGIIHNAEYVQTKRGLKHLFHTKCYSEMIKEHRSWYD